MSSRGIVEAADVDVADPGAPRAVAIALGPGVARDPREVRLAVHEVVANAVEHGGAPVTVTVEDADGGDAVEVVVTDAGGTTRVGEPRPRDERGRGLTLARADSDGLTIGASPDGLGWSVRLRYAVPVTRPGRP